MTKTKTQTSEGAAPKADEEYRREAERLLAETRVMLEETKRSRERGRRHAARTKILLEQLQNQLLCGNN